MNFLCAISYPDLVTATPLHKVFTPSRAKGEVKKNTLWETVQRITANTANKVYDTGMSMLKTTRRSTKGNLLYYKPTRQVITHKRGYSRRAKLPIMLSITSILAFTAELAEITALISQYNQDQLLQGRSIHTKFDTDSFTIGVDSHASACISHNKSHFKDLRHWKGAQLKAIGSTPIQGIGTLTWTIADDNGQPKELNIANSLYVPDISKCLLSPQHFAKQCDNTSTDKTYAKTGAHHTTLKYGDSGQLTRTVQHNVKSNVPELMSAPSCMRYHAFASTIESKSDIYAHKRYCLPCETTTPDSRQLLCAISFEDDEVQSTTPSTANASQLDDEPIETTTMPQKTHFDQVISNEIPYDDEEMVRLAQPEMLQQLKETADVFYRFGHLPYNETRYHSKTTRHH